LCLDERGKSDADLLPFILRSPSSSTVATPKQYNITIAIPASMANFSVINLIMPITRAA
jgi:hypothetical protein